MSTPVWHQCVKLGHESLQIAACAQPAALEACCGRWKRNSSRTPSTCPQKASGSWCSHRKSRVCHERLLRQCRAQFSLRRQGTRAHLLHLLLQALVAGFEDVGAPARSGERDREAVVVPRELLSCRQSRWQHLDATMPGHDLEAHAWQSRWLHLRQTGPPEPYAGHLGFLNLL